MTQDYPDHTRLFHLVGTEITIPINIEASDVTIPVSIAASDVTLNVYLGSLPLETTAENLLTNPGFETGDLTGWVPFRSEDVSVQSEEVWRGSYACKVEPPADSYAYASQATPIPCYPGQRLLVAARLKADANIDYSQLMLFCSSAEDEWVGPGYGPDYGSNYDWTARVAAIVVPDDAAFARVGVRFRSKATPGVGYADSFIAVRLVQPALDSSLNLDINIVAQEIEALDINIAAAAITISMSFTDQSVAVFDAAKWFAHQAAQVFVTGTATRDSGDFGLVIDRIVPLGTTYFITSVSGGYNGAVNAHVGGYITFADGVAIRIDGVNGFSCIFDTPIRVEGANVVELYMAQWSEAQASLWGSFGGYDEVEEV